MKPDRKRAADPPAFDEVLKRMLSTPPGPKKSQAKKAVKKSAKKTEKTGK